MSRPPTTVADLAARLDDPHAELPDPSDLRLAAVIGLLLRHGPDDDDPRLLLTERSKSLRAHAGQVAFPGGKPEAEDESLLHTALREAREEVGLPSEGTTVLGRLNPVPTPSGFFIVPYVGWAPTGWVPRAESSEVHRVITPRLTRLADPAVHRITGRGVWRGYRYVMHEYAVHEPPVWGATARIVWDLLGRLELGRLELG